MNETEQREKPEYPIERLIWNIIWNLTIRPFPRRMALAWERFVLNCLGAKIHKTAVLYSSTRIWLPRNLQMDENSILAYDVDVFNVAPVHLKRHAMVSQNCYLYPGSRALNNSSERLHTPMEIGENAWVASNCFLGNGTIVGRECVIGAGSVVRVSIPAYATVIGNPAKIVGFRYTLEEIIEKETTTYKDCTPIAVNALEKNYEKYFLKRVKEIKDITRL